MSSEFQMSDAATQYSTAYAAHYTSHDLFTALHSYRELVTQHPGTLEALYSRMQIRNIISEVVPEQDLLDAQVDLADTHIKQGSRT